MASGPPRKWVVVVDDDAALRHLWTESLQMGGYTAVGCGSSLEAAALIREVCPHLVVLDLRLEGMSGGELLRTLRDHPFMRRTPILIVSGYLADDASSIPHLGLNIVGMMEKPMSIDEFLAKVAQVLG